MMFINEDIIPVVMFHSVGLENTNWIFSHISEPLKTFEEKIAALVSSGYQFIFWKDLFNHMGGLRRAPFKSIMLTFDDGYLDNWVYVFPILKKYGAKATVFVNPEFVDPGTNIRANLDEVWSGRIAENEIQDLGFLNWEEMRLMEKSGHIDIQSHALTHTWYFSGPKLVDFHRPGGKKYPWLAWNVKPDLKPFYIENEQESLVAFGTPVYEFEKALICRRYFPPEEVTNRITELVEYEGGENFFQKKGWEIKLKEYHESLMDKYRHKERFETDENYQQRVYCELERSKQILEKELNKEIHFICWPGGGYNNTVLTLAKKAGYKAWTLSSKDQSDFRNCFASDPTQIKRISAFSKYRTQKGNEYGYSGGRYFICGIERHKGSFIHKWLGRILLGNRVFQSMLFGGK